MALLLVGLIACAHSRGPAADDPPIAEKPPSLAEFFLGPGDELEITVWRHPELSRLAKVDPSGMLVLPLVGDLQASGMSLVRLRDRIREGLARYIVDPQVGVGVRSLQGQKLFVLGEVSRPGAYQVDRPIGVLEAISEAGGFTLDARRRNVLLIRGGLSNPNLYKLDLARTLKEGELDHNPVLRRGDIVYVPASLFADVDRFFRHVATAISPVVTLEQGIILEPLVKDIIRNIKGREPRDRVILPPPR